VALVQVGKELARKTGKQAPRGRFCLAKCGPLLRRLQLLAFLESLSLATRQFCPEFVFLGGSSLLPPLVSAVVAAGVVIRLLLCPLAMEIGAQRLAVHHSFRYPRSVLQLLAL
jgi:hypothetical protein